MVVVNGGGAGLGACLKTVVSLMNTTVTVLDGPRVALPPSLSLPYLALGCYEMPAHKKQEHPKQPNPELLTHVIANDRQLTSGLAGSRFCVCSSFSLSFSVSPP